jgi:galactitol-specific phosphotransferase system IIB component
MKNLNLKILTVCAHGNVRSVATRQRLNRRGYENVIAIGVNTTTQETLGMLCEWADLILVAEPMMLYQLPEVGHRKVSRLFTIGPDLWADPFNQELKDIVIEQIEKLDLNKGEDMSKDKGRKEIKKPKKEKV